MRPSIAVSLAFGLLGADLAAASVCRPQSSSSVVTDASLTTSSETTHASSSASTVTESSSASKTISVASSDTTQATTSEISSWTTASTSITTSDESTSTSSPEAVSESATTFTTRTTTAESVTTSSSVVASESSTALSESTIAESTTASTTVESSTAQTTTTEPATTDSSTTESSKVTSTSSAPATNPTFNLLVRGNDVDGQYVQNDPSGASFRSRLFATDDGYENVAVYVEEGTGGLRTLFSDYYLCIAYHLSYTENDILPANVQLCNTWSLNNDMVNRIHYITCQLTGENRISCSAPGGFCYLWLEPPRDKVRGRCDVSAGTTFTEFFTRTDHDFDRYAV